MKRSDFKIAVYKNGYRITYKGKSIGGDGNLDRQIKMNPEKEAKARAMHQSHADEEVQALLDGKGCAIYASRINKIESELKAV